MRHRKKFNHLGRKTAHRKAMLSNMASTNGLLLAEAAMFALSEHMTRPEAQALVKKSCAESVKSGQHLREVLETQTDVKIDWENVFNPLNYTGLAGQIVDRLK